MLDIIFVRVGIDEDIINVDHDEIIENIHYDAIDEALKRAGAITEAKGHNKVAVGALTGSESGPVLGQVLHADGVEGVLDVNNGKVLRVLEPLYGLINSWEGVSVFLHDGIQFTVVNTKAPLAVSLLDKEN